VQISIETLKWHARPQAYNNHNHNTEICKAQPKNAWKERDRLW